MKFIVLFSAVVMQMCLGATYSWSVYVQPLKELTGLQQGAVQIPFTVFYFIFPISMMLAGRYLHLLGTRKSAMTGGLLFGGGWLLAGLGDQHFVMTIFGIGLLSGIGAGLAYIVPITVCVKWFPDNKGFVTGIAVAGFGGGAALVSQVGGGLMSVYGLTPFHTFTLLGLAFSLLVCLAGSAMISPTGRKKSLVISQCSTREILTSPSFRLLYLAMAIGLAAGFAVNANLKELLGGGEAFLQAAIMGVSLFALANAAGRIIWGALFDRVSSATLVLQLNLLSQALLLLSGPVILDSIGGYLFFATLSGFNYGGVLVLYVSFVHTKWGTQNTGKVYGLLFTSNIPASISPILAGIVYDMYNSFDAALLTIAAMLMTVCLFLHFQKSVFMKD